MDPSHLSEEFRDFLKCLNDAGVNYLLVGGHAVAFHGYVRPTTDMDIWIALDKTNAEKAVDAIRVFFGTAMEGLTPQRFLDPEQVSRFGSRPNMLEILTRIDGGDFSAAFKRRIKVEIDGVPTNVISLNDLKENTRASGRNKDFAVLDNLP